MFQKKNLYSVPKKKNLNIYGVPANVAALPIYVYPRQQEERLYPQQVPEETKTKKQGNYKEITL